MKNMLERILEKFQLELASLIPGIVFGVVFVIFAYLAIRMIRSMLNNVLQRFFNESREVIGDLILNSTTVLMWFSVILILFNILGMGNIAASLGTASGFAALGISFALSNVIADFVAGIYLIRDPDFSKGDRVQSGSVSGTVKSVELRKCRIQTDEGNTVILANSDVEKMWTRIKDQETSSGSSLPSDPDQDKDSPEDE